MKKNHLKFENNEQFKKGFEWGKQFAKKLEKENPQLAEEMKDFFKNLMKGEKNVNL